MTTRFEILSNRLLDVANRLSRHRTALAEDQSPCWECWWEAIERLSQKNNAAIDAAARLIAAGNLAEPPPPQICVFLVLRLQLAAGILESFEDSNSATHVIAFPQPLAEMSDSQIIEWLLVDFWHCLGEHVWQWVGYWIFDLWRWSSDDPRPHRLSDDQIVT